MSISNNTSLVRQLIPKSYSFDGYNEINCASPRDRPFFSDHTVNLGDYCMTAKLTGSETISLMFASTCSFGKVTFGTYALTLETYVSKLKEAVQDGFDFITLNIPVNYENQSSCVACTTENIACQFLWREKPKTCLAAVSFNPSEMKEALAKYYEITSKRSRPTNGGTSIMKKNNMFGMNFELGMSKDPNISATLMGVAVRNADTGNWYTFDQSSNTRKNISNFKMGSFPIFLLPAKTLEVGDLIKNNGTYYYVKAVNSASNTITLLGAKDGIIREMLPEESIIPGMSLYTKVVAFDTKSLMDNSSKENMGSNVLAAICMMQWAKNDDSADFSLDNIDDDSFNGLGSCLPMLMAMNGNDLGGIFGGADGTLNLPMLMALGSSSADSDSNGMVQTLVLSQLLGGKNSPISGIATSTSVNKTESGESVICEKCGKTYDAGTNFCPKCGGKTKVVSTTCRKCGAILPKDAAFCPKCGVKVAQDTCPQCGRPVEADENFCPGCGRNLKAPLTETISNTEADTSKGD